MKLSLPSFRKSFFACVISMICLPHQSDGLSATITASAVISASPDGVSTPAPYSTVIDVPAGASGSSTTEVKRSKKYLIASYPDTKQVAYCHLPDNIWRPLVVGDVVKPSGVAVDQSNRRLYVSDPSQGKIFYYNIVIDEANDGHLITTGVQYIAVTGFEAKWMTVCGDGNLYFTGKAVVTPPASSYEAIFRQDASKIAMGNPLAPFEVYSRSNSDNPNPKVWMPSGIAVDSFDIYWGNQESGTTHGGVVRGARKNVDQQSAMPVAALNMAQVEVRGLMIAQANIFYLTPNGVYGMAKGTQEISTDVNMGLIAGPPSADTNGVTFNPRSIVWDFDGTGYFTDLTQGMVYSLPVMDTNQHNLTKFVDAPGVYGITLFDGDHAKSSGYGLRFNAFVLLSLCGSLFLASCQ